MARIPKPKALYVEGKDDEHAIGHLLIRRGFAPEALPEFVDSANKDGVLKAIRVAILAGTGKALGFVVDADDDAVGTWTSVTQRLRSAGVEAPDHIPPGGFVGESQRFGARVGVWLMPDNRQTGALEEFLQALIEEEDALLPHAEQSTMAAKKLGARYSVNHTSKAVLHAWLAWQKQPGRPYGVAIQSHYFRGSSEASERFIAWFTQVFRIVPSGSEWQRDIEVES